MAPKLNKKQIIFKFIISGVILISILIFIQLKKENNANSIRPNRIIAKLPKFKTLDVDGNLVKSDNFKGKILYVQFVDPEDNDDINLIKTVFFRWKDENIVFITITKDLDKFYLKSGINLDDLVILNTDYNELKSRFNSPPCCGTYYLFDKYGDLVGTGKNILGYNRGVKIFLDQIIKNKYFSISDFIIANENIKNIEWFDQLNNLVDQVNKKYFVISMFTSICLECMSGLIINTLKEIHSKNQKNMHILCILSDSFNERDKNSLKSQLRIYFPVVVADQDLSLRWNYLIQEFRETDLTNIVFIMDKSGKILEVYHPNCNCWQYFNNILRQLLQQ